MPSAEAGYLGNCMGSVRLTYQASVKTRSSGQVEGSTCKLQRQTPHLPQPHSERLPGSVVALAKPFGFVFSTLSASFPLPSSTRPKDSKLMMAGVEAVSLVLASVPLIIEAFDHSERAIQAFSTYRGYPKEVKKMESKLGAQKTVFRNNCINLLSTLTGDRRTVRNMLSARSSHDLWSKEHLTQILTYHLDSLEQTFDSCQQSMEQISQALQAISKDVGEFSAVLNRSHEVNPVSSPGPPPFPPASRSRALG